MQKVRSNANQKGFTLLEVIVAASILAVAMLSLVPLLISSYRIDKETLYRVRAQQLVTQRLDELIAQENLVCGGAASTDFIDAHSGAVYAAVPTVPVVITRTWTVGAPVGLTSLCTITVAAAYTDSGGAKTYQAVSRKGR
jgi:prepilin-type N-terminal cleavage/methylation domain-containing protein